MPNKNYLLLLILLLLKAFVMAGLVDLGYIGLGPDEAQYWTWSQKLDWGYYSKPPGIAWQIWLGTRFFGNTELGVRIGAVAIGTLLPLAVYALAAACRLKPWTCTMAAIIFAFSPLGMLSTLLAITDGGMVLFWTLATAAFCLALPLPKPYQYYLVGLCVLCGALFKWPIYLFWPFVIAWAALNRQLFNGHLWGAIILSLLGMLPSLIWNMQHDWATFRHVSATIHNPGVELGTTQLMNGNFWEFIGAQATLLSPVLFVLLLGAFWSMIVNWRTLNAQLQFCGASAFILLAGYAVAAIFKKMQGNWCDFAFPGAVVLLSWFIWEQTTKLKAWAYAGIALSITLVGLFLSIPYLQSHGLPSCCPIPFKSNPFKHNLGWDQLSNALSKAGYDPKTDFLFADRYQNSSILSFYGPEQKLAYFLNLHGIRKNQFSYWTGMEQEQVGRTGYFGVVENSPQTSEDQIKIEKQYAALLKPYFENVSYLGLQPLYETNGSISKGIYLFKCTNYNGKQPAETALY